eukprot:CAMPEP_0184681998 /NCGR_PEP_ID=MMETSP0312-20130426/5267_1 /TAXON_ID=31354 /ORGANISM="Compsopogon coeruleus, Strain SAG 36.94" /LENGTH=259 /DNA_ID=CAMNT_0027133215 /DNA_START=55 /DNA_END=834 /DNA_ORIENTATION=-
MAPIKKLRFPRVSETILKRRRAGDAAQARAVSTLLKGGLRRRQGEGEKGSERFVRKAEQFVLDYRNKERFSRKAMRGRRSQKKIQIPRRSRVLLVIRIRGGRNEPGIIRKALKSLGVGQQSLSAVIVPATEESVRLLREAETFVTWGTPTLKVVKDLIYKRGFCKFGATDELKRVPITDNRTIEDNLGHHGIICTEDIIDELFRCGEAFSDVRSVLLPFELNRPKDAELSKTLRVTPYKDGGVYGDRGDQINSFVEQLS